MVQKYLNRISGPLLDRIDIHIEVVPVNYDKLSDSGKVEHSSVVRERVVRAREIQAKDLSRLKESIQIPRCHLQCSENTVSWMNQAEDC